MEDDPQILGSGLAKMVLTINRRSTGTDSANFKIIMSELQIILPNSTVFFFLLNNTCP
jgi:hypothetical protein